MDPAGESVPEPLELAFEARITVGTPIESGPPPGGGGQHRIIPITGGCVDGPRLSGRILPVGADWQVLRPDGVAELEARYVIEAADGARIGVYNRGLRHGPAEIMEKLRTGQPVPPDSYYFRSSPVFSPPDGAHAWLARWVFLGRGERRPDSVILRVYAWR